MTVAAQACSPSLRTLQMAHDFIHKKKWGASDEVQRAVMTPLPSDAERHAHALRAQERKQRRQRAKERRALEATLVRDDETPPPDESGDAPARMLQDNSSFEKLLAEFKMTPGKLGGAANGQGAGGLGCDGTARAPSNGRPRLSADDEGESDGESSSSAEGVARERERPRGRRPGGGGEGSAAGEEGREGDGEGDEAGGEGEEEGDGDSDGEAEGGGGESSGGAAAATAAATAAAGGSAGAMVLSRRRPHSDAPLIDEDDLAALIASAAPANKDASDPPRIMWGDPRVMSGDPQLINSGVPPPPDFGG